MPEPLRAIAFDFDGVILESTDVKTDAFVALFSDRSREIQNKVREHHLANLGISRFVKFAWIHENLLHEPLSDEQSKALGEQFSSLVLEKVLAAPVVPGARESVREPAATYPLFVVSGTPQEELDLICDRRGLRDVFVEIHGSPRKKPDILRDILARKGWSNEELLFVGDGESDYDAARAVNLPFLARDTAELHDRWRALGVELRPDLTDLPQVVRALSR